MFVYLCSKQTDACTAWLMHSTVVSYFLGRLSIIFVKFWHLCVLLYVWPRQARTIPSLQLQELRKRVVRCLPIMYTKSGSNWHAILSLLQRGRPCHSPEFRAPRNFFVESSSPRLLFMRNSLLCISALQFFTRVSVFFFTAISWLLAETKSWLLSGRSVCLEQTRQRIRLLFRFVDSSKWSHALAGYIGLEKRKAVRPAVREMYVRACSHQENFLLSRCEGEGYAKRISFFFYILAKEVVFTLAVGWRGYDQPSSTCIHATCLSRHGAAGCFRPCAGAACSRLLWSLAISIDRHLRYTVCTVSRLIFSIRTFSLCDSQLFRSPPKSIRKLRCETG